MKEKIKRIINLIILTIIAIITFIVAKSIPSLLIGKTQEVTKIDSNELLSLAPGSVFDLNTSNTNQITSNGNTYWKVTVDGIDQIYCAEKGAHFSRYGSSYEEVVSYVDAHRNDSSDGSCVRPETLESRSYYKITSTRQANNAEAFLLTWPSPEWNSWLAFKQEAIWDSSSLSNNVRPPKDSIDGIIGDQLTNYSIFYGYFANEIQANGSKIVRADTTNQAEVRKQLTQSTKEYIVGPFSIDYVNGMYGLVFGGISDMYIVGEKTPRIEIKSFIINDVEITPAYFRMIDDKNLVGLGTQGYPKPNEQFYVKYVSTSDEQINKLHVDFEWMEAEATITYYDAYKYKSSFTCSHSSHCHGHSSEPHWCSEHQRYEGGGTRYCGGCCYTCSITSANVIEYSPGYQQLLSATGSRRKHTESLEIIVPDHTKDSSNPYNSSNPGGPGTPSNPNTPQNPNVPPTKNLQIKLAGKVWEDEQSGKESLPNGIKDSSENYKAGVEVILHYANGAEVKRTVTDSSGYYEFTDLNAEEKYYIEFVYDGQKYQATQYNTGLSKEQRLAGNITNATEINSERENFNNNFAQISSAPGSYTVRRSLYYSVGSTNSAYIVDKTSSETPYGIKEIYDYVIEQATNTKSYSIAYANALNNFGNNNSTRSKLQFIEDCRISSYTGYNTSRQTYPIWDRFVESYESKIIAGQYFYALYPTHLNIDFGLTKRETFDLALRKDVEKATVEINGKVHTYTYDTRSGMDEADGGTWDINIRLADSYYNTKYSREVFGSDYQYKASNYGNAAEYGKTKEDELNVYVTYKLTVRNQSQTILGEVMEIVDYYDEDYEYVDERSYIEIKYGNNKGQHSINAYSDSRYGSGNQTQIPGYNAVYVRGLEGIKLTSGQTAYVYLTFKIKKDNINGEDWIRLDEQLESATAIGVGKENIAEINGFRTYYREDTQIPNVGKVSGQDKVAGLFDKDSVPGNLNPNDVPKDGNINYANFEDDTDKAPNIRLILYRDKNSGELVCRTMDGIVWEDERTEKNSDQVTIVGDGIRQDDENAINGVTVQLVELMDNGTEYVWKTFSSGQNYINGNDVYTPIINVTGPSGNALIKADKDTTQGKYIFKSYMAGNYVVRFIYGDTVKTVLPNTSTEVTNLLGQNGQNAKSYNGQDYKSTTYQEGIVQLDQNDIYNNNAPASFTYNITASDAKTNVSDAKDIMTDNNINTPYYRQSATLNSREDVIDYSDNDVMNYIAEVLVSHEKLPLNSQETAIKLQELMNETQMTAETGRINIEVEYDRNATGNQLENNDTTYKIQDLSLGLEERAKSQLTINKEVTNVQVVLADGATLFDATQKATNVMWRKHKGHEFKYSDYQLAQDPMVNIRSYDLIYGQIQLSMDEELMHGATIKVSYKITVRNVGEVDYKDNSFYYTGIVSDKNTIVKTSPNQVIDYVANNLQFYAVDNSSWEVISKDELLSGPVNLKLANAIEKYNTVITTNSKSNIANSKLVPEMYGSGTSSVSDTLILTQLITSENETDDLTYRNIVEIVKTSNDVGRRNAYSVVGNQNPTKDVTEVDTDVAEIIKILPPYGNGGIYYIIGTIVILASAILISGIIFIKKKVLR